MLKIGLTGGIGSGKSSVSKILDELGAYIFDADSIGKKILRTSKIAQNEIIKEFGTDVTGVDGKIQKKKLAKIAFQDESKQLKLNTIIHPYIFEEIDRTFEKILKLGKHDNFIVDAALIYESGADTHMDYVIVVTSHLNLRIERVLQRGDLTREEFLKRVDLQWPDEDKTNMADFIIKNNSSKENLVKETNRVYYTINY